MYVLRNIFAIPTYLFLSSPCILARNINSISPPFSFHLHYTIMSAKQQRRDIKNIFQNIKHFHEYFSADKIIFQSHSGLTQYQIMLISVIHATLAIKKAFNALLMSCHNLLWLLHYFSLLSTKYFDLAKEIFMKKDTDWSQVIWNTHSKNMECCTDVFDARVETFFFYFLFHVCLYTPTQHKRVFYLLVFFHIFCSFVLFCFQKICVFKNRISPHSS